MKIDLSGFVPLLTVLFVALKLTGHIAWSWLWVLSPLWISGGLLVMACLIALGIYIVAER